MRSTVELKSSAMLACGRASTNPVFTLGGAVTPQTQPPPCVVRGCSHDTTGVQPPARHLGKPSEIGSDDCGLTGQFVSACIIKSYERNAAELRNPSGLTQRCRSESSESTPYPRAVACAVNHQRCKKSM
eukprot:1130707-Prymnesium_polylepis.2